MNVVSVGGNRIKTTADTKTIIVKHSSSRFAAFDGAADGNGCYANELSYCRASSYRDDNSRSDYPLPQVRFSFESRRTLKNFNLSSSKYVRPPTILDAYYESFSFDEEPSLSSSPENEIYLNRRVHHNQLLSSPSNIYSSQVAMQQRRLIVPSDSKSRSHSTPSSPKLLLHSSDSAKDRINNNTIAIPLNQVRKHSYDDRITQIREDDHPRQLGRNFSVGTLNRRLLPATPQDNCSKEENLLNQSLQYSLPRMPPQSERKKSAPALQESFSSQSNKSSDDGIVVRTGTGRRLPLVPDFSNEIRNEGYHKQWQQDEFINLTRPCKTPPLINNIKTSCYAYPPDLHTNRASSPYSRKYCQRRTSEQSIDQYVGVPCTCSTPPPCMPISEHLESKSSSDTEDHAATALLFDKRDSITDSVQMDELYECEPDEKSYGLGRLLFSILYFPIRKRLRVSIIKAENLAGRLKPDLELNTFLKICLMPGKIQKQRSSRVVKGNRNAIFNEEYFFDNVEPEDIKTKTVLIRICHRMPKNFLKDVVVGELDLSLISLSTISSKREIKLCRELRPKVVKKLGRLQITTMLEKEARRLTINILKVDNLPKYGITGPPDPCVKITVEQNGQCQTKQSRTIKSTCHASFKEAVMFLVSTRISDLENTNIDICVHDMARTATGEDVIGRVILGPQGKDRILIEQWRNTFMNPGKEVKGMYTLKHEDNEE